MPRTRHPHPRPNPGPHPRPVPPAPAPPAPAPAPTPSQYLWNPSFAGAAGTLPSSADWNFVTGPGAQVGGNNETETYVKSAANSYLDGNGNLVLAVTKGLKSARLTSTFSVGPGTSWEAQITLDNVQGCWPAFWFMSTTGGPYPSNWCEVDVCESYGEGIADSTIWNGTATTGVSNSQWEADSAPHVYRMDNAGTSISVYRDNVLVNTASAKNCSPWLYGNAELYCILNIATDGTGTKNVNPNPADLPSTMTIGYVRAFTLES
jgi:Glycosyl hydrolases family 16